MDRWWIFAKKKPACFWLWCGGLETPGSFLKGHYSTLFLIFTCKTGSRLNTTGMLGYPKESEKPWPHVLLSCTQNNWISPWEMHDTTCYREWQGVVRIVQLLLQLDLVVGTVLCPFPKGKGSATQGYAQSSPHNYIFKLRPPWMYIFRGKIHPQGECKPHPCMISTSIQPSRLSKLCFKTSREFALLPSSLFILQRQRKENKTLKEDKGNSWGRHLLFGEGEIRRKSERFWWGKMQWENPVHSYLWVVQVKTTIHSLILLNKLKS